MNRELKMLLLVFICGLFAFASESKGMPLMELQESFLSESNATAPVDLILEYSDFDLEGSNNDTSLSLPTRYSISAAARHYHSIQRQRVLHAKSLLRNITRYTKYQLIKSKYIFLNLFIKDAFSSLVLKSRFHDPDYLLVAKRVLII